jgi:predicted NBD/HSP70 family sugar kinase
MNSRPAQRVAHVISSAPQHQGVRRIDLSSAQLASSELARDINRDIVLEFIRFRQPVSRVDLSRLSGLQPSTISAIVEDLIEEGWVREGDVVRGGRGRPSTMLLVNNDLVTLALDIRPGQAIIAVVDLSGHFLSHETIVTETEPRAAIAKLIKHMRMLRSRHKDKTFEGIGVSVPGRVDPVTHRLLMAPNLGWEGFDIREALEKGMGLQVEIENDANACLLSELWFGRLDGIRNAVLVAVSEGLGTAILSGGQMHSGYNGLAGEFGHISVDPKGPMCECGQRGCWETVASSRVALDAYRKLSRRSHVKDIQTLLRMAQDGDAAAAKAIRTQAIALGRGLRLITAALSPERILITGELTACWEIIGPVVQEELQRGMLAGPTPQLTTAGDGYLARLSGGAALLLQRHSHYHRSTHGTRARKPVRKTGAKKRRQAVKA